VSEVSKLSCLTVLTRALLRQIEELHNDSELHKHFDLKLRVQKFEEELIRKALAVTRGRQRAAARLLGTKTTTLHNKIRRYKVAVEQIGEDDGT